MRVRVLWHCLWASLVILSQAACKNDKDCGGGQCCGEDCIGPLPDHVCCRSSNGSKVRCGPTTSDQCSKQGYGLDAPQFHVRDRSCGENDPNGVVYDAKHGVYHVMYQDHVGAQGGSGPVYGHAVSKDLVHWSHLPVTIWNTKAYDHVAIFTGSATIIDGTIAQIYPGIGTPDVWPGCPGGAGAPACISLVLAVPADPNDPLATNWTKKAVIVNNTARDPSTAWKTAAGEWRLTTFDGVVYGSMDFMDPAAWYKIGMQSGFGGGECPSFFPLPGATDSKLHVYKASHGFGNGDWMEVGRYTANGPRQNGTWEVLVPAARADFGRTAYAGKDFWDPVGVSADGSTGRRINWAWANVPPDSVQTLPREVRWEEALHQLTHSPLPEQDHLRSPTTPLATRSAALSPPGSGGSGSSGSGGSSSRATIPVLGSGNGKAQLEIEVSFTMPSAASAEVPLQSAAYDGDGDGSARYYTITVGAQHANSTRSRNNSSDSNSDSDSDSDSDSIRRSRRSSKRSRTPGLLDPPYPAHDNPTFAPLRLLPADKELVMKVYVDGTMSEAYFMGGRVAMTIQTCALTTINASSHGGVSVFADWDWQRRQRDRSENPPIPFNATVWGVGSIWIAPGAL